MITRKVKKHHYFESGATVTKNKFVKNISGNASGRAVRSELTKQILHQKRAKELNILPHKCNFFAFTPNFCEMTGKGWTKFFGRHST
jgi:hypothetical protein